MQNSQNTQLQRRRNASSLTTRVDLLRGLLHDAEDPFDDERSLLRYRQHREEVKAVIADLKGSLRASRTIWQVTPSMLRGAAVAFLYVREVLPLRSSVLLDATEVDAFFDAEGILLTELRQATAHAPGLSPHAFCDNSYWYSAALADCRDWLATIVRHGGHVPALAHVDCSMAAQPAAHAAQLLWGGLCLSDRVLLHQICGLMPLALGHPSAEALPHFETAVIVLLLCDGCRFDGRGIYATQLTALAEATAALQGLEERRECRASLRA